MQREHQQSEVCEICLWHLAGDGVRWTDLRTTHHSDNCLTLLNAPSVWSAPLVSRGRQFKAFKVSMHKLPVKDRGRKGFRCLTPASRAAKLRERQLRSCFPARWLLIATTCALPASKPQAVPQHTHTWLLYAELLHRCRRRTGLLFRPATFPSCDGFLCETSGL